MAELPDNIRAESVGEWYACKECYELIEADKYDALSMRSAAHWPLDSKDQAYRFLRALHAKFREWRTGPPTIL